MNCNELASTPKMTGQTEKPYFDGFGVFFSIFLKQGVEWEKRGITGKGIVNLKWQRSLTTVQTMYKD